jgi:hypothetical protein
VSHTWNQVQINRCRYGCHTDCADLPAGQPGALPVSRCLASNSELHLANRLILHVGETPLVLYFASLPRHTAQPLATSLHVRIAMAGRVGNVYTCSCIPAPTRACACSSWLRAHHNPCFEPEEPASNQQAYGQEPLTLHGPPASGYVDTPCVLR